MLVLADLATLWDRPFSGATTMAVQDSLVPFVSSRFGVGGYEELRMDPDTPYFNAGMMVIDVDAWRTGGISRLALEYLKARVVSVKFEDDAKHVATCTVYRVNHLVSWNFKHIVNLRRIRGYNSVNLKYGYPILEIRTPAEVLE